MDGASLVDLPKDASGLAAALDQIGPAGRLDVEGEQRDLFASSPLAAIAPGLAPKGRGRPPGAQNRSTADWVAFFQRTRRSPLLLLSDVANAPTEELAVSLGCTRLEALTLQVSCADKLAPYLHRRQPMAIDAGEGRPLPTITHVIVQPQALFSENDGESIAYDMTPLPPPAEVASEKSHAPQEMGQGD